MIRMARLIKRNTMDAPDATLVDHSTVGAIAPSAARPSSIIDRDTFEARSQAQQIREKAEQQANGIREKAQSEAEQLLAAAREEAEQLKATAKEEGLQEGKAEGVAKLSEAVATASTRVEALEAELIPQLQQLALAITRKILGKELETHPDEVVSIVKQALGEKARQRREIVLRVHPDDLDIVRGSRAELLEVLNRCKEIGIREDPEVARFGVVIETDAGTIDAQLETQLAVFERAFKGME